MNEIDWFGEIAWFWIPLVIGFIFCLVIIYIGFKKIK